MLSKNVNFTLMHIQCYFYNRERVTSSAYTVLINQMCQSVKVCTQ